MKHPVHETPPFAYGYNPEAMPQAPPPEGVIPPPGAPENPYQRPGEVANPFDQNPDLAMDAAVDGLFAGAEAQFQEERPLDEDAEDLSSPKSSTGYDGLAVDIGTGEYLSVERIQNPDEAVPGKPRTIITKPVERGSYNGVEYSHTERYVEGPDGKWHKEVDVDLGPGAEDIFGTNKIQEEVPTDMDDMRAVHNTVQRPNNVRKLQRNTPQVAGSGAGLSERAP